MRLPLASGRGVLGEGRSKFTHKASPAALPGQCLVHFWRDSPPPSWDRVYRILWDALHVTLAMQLHLAHVQPNYGSLPYVPLSDLLALLRPSNPTAAAGINMVLAPAVAACMSPDSSTSTPPAPIQSIDAARINSLEARMDEQSALIASLAQGMHKMLQQMKQLRCDTVAAASAHRSATATSAPTLRSTGLPGQTGPGKRPTPLRFRLA
eukprot:5133676-Pleurochrysis_carterae.AAC.8